MFPKWSDAKKSKSIYTQHNSTETHIILTTLSEIYRKKLHKF